MPKFFYSSKFPAFEKIIKQIGVLVLLELTPPACCYYFDRDYNALIWPI